MLRLTSIFTCILLTGCGSSSNDDNSTNNTITFDSIEFAEMSDSNLEITSDLIKGSGALIAVNPLATVDSGNSFTLSGALPAGASVTLVANANKQLDGGLEFLFSRNADAIAATVTFGAQTVSISEYFKDQNPDALSLTLDIHNDESPAHVLIWKSEVSEFSEEQAFFNSEDAVEMPGNGTGTFWGIKSSLAEISKLTISEPKFEEE